MTIVASVKSRDGLILAADSMPTITVPTEVFATLAPLT